MRLKISDLPPKMQAQIEAMDRATNKLISVLVAPTPAKVVKPRLRQSNGDGMNKTERAFSEWLKRTYPDSLVYREISLPIANGCRFKVDFTVVFSGSIYTRIDAYEVKGFMRDDAAVKLKVAASVYPWIMFHLVTKTKTGWDFQTILP